MTGDRPFRVLFACVGNSARSQMAEGFAKAWGGHRVDAKSGGSAPLGRLLPGAIAVMKEVGIDISGHESEGFDESWIREADLVVTMGCGEDACPAFAGKPMEDWRLEDPAGKELEVFRRVRDEISKRVETLLIGQGIRRK